MEYEPDKREDQDDEGNFETQDDDIYDGDFPGQDPSGETNISTYIHDLDNISHGDIENVYNIIEDLVPSFKILSSRKFEKRDILRNFKFVVKNSTEKQLYFEGKKVTLYENGKVYYQKSFLQSEARYERFIDVLSKIYRESNNDIFHRPSYEDALRKTRGTVEADRPGSPEIWDFNSSEKLPKVKDDSNDDTTSELSIDSLNLTFKPEWLDHDNFRSEFFRLVGEELNTTQEKEDIDLNDYPNLNEEIKERIKEILDDNIEQNRDLLDPQLVDAETITHRLILLEQKYVEDVEFFSDLIEKNNPDDPIEFFKEIKNGIESLQFIQI